MPRRWRRPPIVVFLVGDTASDLEAGARAGVALRLQIPSDGDLRQVLDRVPDLRADA